MNTALFIAKRYLFAKKSTNAINLIAMISMMGVWVGTAALVIIVSVFNGFEKQVLAMFNAITPDLVISPAKGKVFNPNTAQLQDIQHNPAVFSYTQVLQENALLKYNNKQAVALVKGVSIDYLKNDKLDSILLEGRFVLNNSHGYNAVAGSAIQAYLNINTTNPFIPLEVYALRKGSTFTSINPMDDLSIAYIPVSGIFEVQQQYDNTLIVPLNFARAFLNDSVNVSSVEINLQPGQEVEPFKNQVRAALGAAFQVDDRFEQNKSLYHILNTEKWAVFVILTFVLLIAIFNILGSLTMLVIDKHVDIAVLSSLGADASLIKRIFWLEGMLISLIGCLGGLITGLIFCLLQQKFEWIKMDSAGMPYPVEMFFNDFVLVFCTVAVFSFLASALSARLSVKNIQHINTYL